MKRSNESGSAIIWVVLASSVIAVIAAGLIAISISYYNSQKSSTLDITQSYLNAKSGIESVYSYISSVPDSSSPQRAVYDKIIGLGVGEDTDISFNSDDDGEYVTVNVKRQTDLTVILTATSESSSEKCVLTAKTEKQPFENADKWGELVYID